MSADDLPETNGEMLQGLTPADKQEFAMCLKKAPRSLFRNAFDSQAPPQEEDDEV